MFNVSNFGGKALGGSLMFFLQRLNAKHQVAIILPPIVGSKAFGTC
jgi:hypothetical protein